MPTALTLESPFHKRFMAWINERFALPNGLLFLVLYFTAVFTGHFAVGGGEVEIGWRELLGFAPAWCYFLMLRIFDEHKDYDDDLVNYPDRVLQSGLITLGHLKVVGVICIAVQMFGSLLLDGGFGKVTMWWLVVFGYSLLMGKEFFVPEWLKSHFVLYAVSHMLSMPVVLIWLAQIGAGSETLPLEIGLLAGLAFLSGTAFEVTRKMRGPEEERENVDSYTKIMGTGGAPVFVFAVLTASAGVQVALLHWVFGGDVAWWWYAILVGGLVLPGATLMKFRSEPSAKMRETNEGTVALNMLMSYVVLIAAVWVHNGATLAL